MSVIFIDSDCELNYKTAEEVGLNNVILMPYTICNQEIFYDLGKSYNAKEFFDLVRKGNMPITSGLNVETYKEYFEPFFKKEEDILYVSFSAEMSGTFQYHDIAIKELQEKYPKAKYRRFDTKAISLAAGLPCYYAGLMHKEGKTNDEIVDFLNSFVYKVNAILSPNNLNYLKRGGRLSSAKAAFGTFLQVKPIIRLTDEGKLVNTSKVNGRNKCLSVIAQDVIDRADFNYPIIVLNADCLPDSDKIVDKIRATQPDADIWIYDIGPVIGAHAGPDTIACVYVGKDNRRYVD